jgi:hypothetical protein
MDLISAAQDGHHLLYHYQPFNERTADRLERTLRDRTIYMSKPSAFNDPWDCKPWFDARAFDDPNERRQYLQWLQRTTEVRPAEAQAMLADPRLMAAAFEAIHLGHVRAIAETYRVYCLLPDATNLLLWAHYADSHKGIALEFDARHPQIQWAYRVHYRDMYPPVHMYEEDENANLIPLFTKARVWEYEHEYRMISEERQRPQPIMLETQDSTLRLEPGALVGIVIGCQCDEDHALDIINQYGPDIRVRRARRKSDRYSLTLETIR